MAITTTVLCVAGVVDFAAQRIKAEQEKGEHPPLWVSNEFSNRTRPGSLSEFLE
jgi:hypothetical protein